LPFEDKRDFDEAKKGFIAEPPYKKIMADAGHVAWDMGSYQWLLAGKDFQSIHPSLQRQAVLNMAYGLYEVVPGRIYQVRGFDLANISFIKGDTGWIVFDPLTAKETARAALELINEKLGKRPVVGVVYSHSHIDHFGGVRGVVDEADVASGKVKIIAPRASSMRRFPRTSSRATPCRAAHSTRTPCCCRVTRTATQTSRSARTWPMAMSV
jgi:alkyl sulfatase BDS1-like metallo-beta-lactamase superfamily hydrolase